MLMYSRNQHNVVKQLFANENFYNNKIKCVYITSRPPTLLPPQSRACVSPDVLPATPPTSTC